MDIHHLKIKFDPKTHMGTFKAPFLKLVLAHECNAMHWLQKNGKVGNMLGAGLESCLIAAGV